MQPEFIPSSSEVPQTASLDALGAGSDADRTLAGWGVALALVAVIALVPALMSTQRLRGDVNELTSAIRSLEDRLTVVELERDSLRETVTADVEDIRAQVDERMRDLIDSSAVIEHIEGAVFTVRSGWGQGSGFGFLSLE